MSQHFYKKIQSTKNLQEMFRKINPILFDVSLRDGIQGALVESYPSEKKIEIFDKIIRDENPSKMEIGSIVSYRHLPIMKDTIPLYQYCIANNHRKSDIYVLVPSISKLNVALFNQIQNYSFITSVSNAFQLKNTCRTIETTKADFFQMFERIEKYTKNARKKLYISCIDHCPIVGKISRDTIIEEIVYYNTHYPFDEICLSDTCGNLSYDNFAYIVNHATLLGVNIEKLSIHLHICPKNMDNVEQILKFCWQNDLNKFDVSTLETGGCSVTMNRDQLLPNLSYELFYVILYKYMVDELEKKVKDI